MKQEILQFCLEKGLLLDKDILDLFSETSDTESIKLIIEKIQNRTKQRIITKNLISENRDEVTKFFSELPEQNQKVLEKLKIKLGLSIEISREKTIVNESKIVQNTKEGNVKVLSSIPIFERKVEVKDFVKHFRNRFSDMRNILQGHSELNNLVSINKVSRGEQGISIIGMVYNKSVTKNKNILFEIEDLTGKIRVLVNKDKKELYEKAEEVTLDSVLGFKGAGNGEIFFANDIIFPDSRLDERKKSFNEESVLFIGDLHFGSKLFLKESFLKFIDYLNSEVAEVRRIRYLFLVGDIVTGVGNYPNQEKDLELFNLEEQFSGLAELLSKIRKDIKIIISPGNHDGVRLMEPQPFLDEKYAWPLYELDNVVITSNPCYVNIASDEEKSFSGFNVLTYHGFSYSYYANNISSLISKKAMNCPEEIMKYLLRNRHLAPTHSSTQYFPLEQDGLLIKEVPDILVSAHTHKCGVSYYNNVMVISTSCWEAMTPYQEKFGNKPDHCKVPMVNLKTREVKILDFE